MSVPTIGDFTPHALQDIIRRSDDVFNPESPDPDYVAEVPVVKMIREISKNRKYEGLEDPRKDNTLKTVWTKKCDVTVDEDFDRTQNCDITGVETGSDSQEFTLDIHKQSPGFSLSQNKYLGLGPTLTWEEEFAINLTAEGKAMDEIVNAAGVNKLTQWAGNNKFTDLYDVAGDITNIPPSAWNFDLFAYFNLVRKYNKYPKMRLLLGGLLSLPFEKLAPESATENGAANVRKSELLGPVFQDLFTVEEELGAKRAFLVDPDSVGFAHKAYHSIYPAAGQEEIANGNKQILTTFNSKNIPGVVYDLIVQRTCTDGDWITTGKLFFHGAYLLRPKGCDDDRSGVLEFGCAA